MVSDVSRDVIDGLVLKSEEVGQALGGHGLNFLIIDVGLCHFPHDFQAVLLVLDS